MAGDTVLAGGAKDAIREGAVVASSTLHATAGRPPDDGSVHVPSVLDTVRWGRLPSRGADPVAVVADGGVVTIDTVSHEGILDDQGRDPVGFFGRHGVPPEDVLPDCRALAASSLRRDPEAGPHVVTGPVAVEGAEPGDLLAVTVRSLGLRAGYGIVSNRHGKGALPGELPEGGAAVVSTFCPVVGDAGRWFGSITGAPRPDGTAPQVHFPLAPFLGITAVATDTDDEASSTPPGAHGGNLDIKHLVVGSTLYLPVQVPGALLSVGDPHYAQGNGEVALTALEAPLRAVLELRVVSGTATAAAAATTGFLAGPSAETDDAYIAIGLDTDLDEAVRKATRAALQIVEARTGLDRASAYAYLSAAVDFEVSQVVDGVKGIHAVIPKADLRP